MRLPIQPRRRVAFTIVELLVVVSIIVLLVAILLPTLTNALELANRVKCASNLRQIGSAITQFAADHHGRMPATQVCWNAGWNYVPPDGVSQDGTTLTPIGTSTGNISPGMGHSQAGDDVIYAENFFELTDKYGAGTNIFTCPSVSYNSNSQDNQGQVIYTRNIDGSNSQSYNVSQAQCRAEVGEYRQITGYADTNQYPMQPPVNYSGDPPEPPTGIMLNTPAWSKYTWIQNNFVQTDYAYMGSNPLLPRLPWEVFLKTDKTMMGTAVDDDPPIMCDRTFIKGPCAANLGAPPVFAHGRRWIQDMTDPLGLPGRQMGDIKINVLYIDGHVETKSPDPWPFSVSGDTSPKTSRWLWWYR